MIFNRFWKFYTSLKHFSQIFVEVDIYQYFYKLRKKKIKFSEPGLVSLGIFRSIVKIINENFKFQ